MILNVSKQLAILAMLSTPCLAQDFYGLDGNTGTLLGMDTTTNVSTVIGTITGGSPFGFSQFVPTIDGNYYAIAPGLVSGYSIYTVDGSTLQATLLHTPTAARTTGGVGAALSPFGDKLYVAGFRGLSFRVILEEIDLSTGTLVTIGDIPPGWGLAFDSLGNLYTTTQGTSYPDLYRIDLSNPLNSVLVGTLTGVDYTNGIDLASDAGTGSIHAYSRISTTLYSVDSTNGAATLLSVQSNASNITSVKEVPCTSVELYGAGCAGSGGFTPRLSVSGCPEINTTITLQLTQCLGGSVAGFLFGTGQLTTPLGFGCDLLVSPLLPLSVSFTTSPGGAGDGSAFFPVAIPWMPAGDVTLQAIVIDGGTLNGFVVSNGVVFHF